MRLFRYPERIQEEAIQMDGTIRTPFNIESYLSTVGVGRTIIRFKPRHIIFPQGGAADSVYYLQSGRAKLSVVSKKGKEATVSLLASGDFFGEECMAGAGTLRTATATSVTPCLVLRISALQMKQVLHQENVFSDFFMRFILLRGIRTQEDLIDQLFNSSERRLARTLLLMAEFGNTGEPEPLLPRVTQETLAAMVGTTRSRISFFMNRFRKLGLIDYNGRIRVNKALLNAVLRDQLPDQNASSPVLVDPPPSRPRKANRTKRTGTVHAPPNPDN
jgi:CRP/FNR family cyclic AMP-dependent transcriptional regulator